MLLSQATVHANDFLGKAPNRQFDMNHTKITIAVDMASINSPSAAV